VQAAVARQAQLLGPLATLADASARQQQLLQLRAECERQGAAAERLLALSEAALEAKRHEAEAVAQRVEDVR